MIRRLTSSPKPATRVAAFMAAVSGGVDPQPVAHAVVAGQVARRLGRRDQVVGGEPVADGRDRHLVDLGPGAARATSTAASSRASTSGSMPAGSSVMRPMRRPSTPSLQRRPDGRGRLRDRRGVERVVPGDDLEEQRGVGDGGGERADLVEARGEGDQPVAADRAVGRLDADDAAQRRRLADRAAGVGAERQRREAGGHGGGAPARRAARAPGSGRAGCGSGRRPSSRSTSPWRTRRGWSCRR